MSDQFGKKRLVRWSAALYGLAVLVLGLAAGEPSEAAWWLGAVVFLGWVASPIIGGFLIARALRNKHAFWIAFILIVLIAAVGFADQWYVMFVGPSDAQNALIMIFVPLYQWLAVACALAVSWVLGRLVFKSSADAVEPDS